MSYMNLIEDERFYGLLEKYLHNDQGVNYNDFFNLFLEILNR